ncbi:hypothetical protein NQ176_g4794 [Zarea fungicola]|uniref:Uncharacterized protein n=1 Tax=Zarea fungicola TaxID=93591 RepID=A0ACC1NDK4_9HYPO|nr:hypothetical protein NQ176_g4794 [Lecanicillium fungicola]
MSSEMCDPISSFRAYIAAVNSRDWPSVASWLQPAFSYNQATAHEYLAEMQEMVNAMPDLSITIDQLFADKRSPAIFARIVKAGTLTKSFMDMEPAGRQFEFWELCFCQFEDGKVKHIRATQPAQQMQIQAESVPRTPFESGFFENLPERADDLGDWFKSNLFGIASGNVRETLLKNAAPEVLFNGTQRVSVERIIESNLTVQEAARGLHIEIDALVVDEKHQRVGCVYNVIGEVAKDFKTFKVGQTGISCKFVIHYRDANGKKAAMWSIMDSERSFY